MYVWKTDLMKIFFITLLPYSLRQGLSLNPELTNMLFLLHVGLDLELAVFSVLGFFLVNFDASLCSSFFPTSLIHLRPIEYGSKKSLHLPSPSNLGLTAYTKNTANVSAMFLSVGMQLA